MSVSPKKNSFLGLLAGAILSILGKERVKPTTDDIERMEFKTSTQRMGVRFTEKIRNVFRFRWLK